MHRAYGWMTLALAALATRASSQETKGRSDSVFARVSGVVYDSVGRRPLAGATVQLVLAANPLHSRVTMTSESGAFHFDSIGTGTWLAGFFDRALDDLTLDVPLTRVDVREPGDIRLMLAIPSPATIVARTCGEGAVKDSTGLFIGYVRAATGNVTAAAHVQVKWSEIAVGRTGVQRLTPALDADVGVVGAFAFCGVPVSSPILVRAWADRDSSGFVELDVPATGLLRRDIVLGAARPVAIATPAAADSIAPDSAAPVTTVYRGNGRLRGVVQRANGTPIEGARLVFWGSGIQATTGADGAFALRELPTGTWTLETRALGLFPVRQAVDILADSEVVTAIRMDPIKTVLDTVKVVAQRVYFTRAMQEFEQRKKGGFGYFMDEDAIDRRNPIFVADLFRMAPGVSVMPSSGFGFSIVMRGRSLSRGYCVPAFFVDGTRMMVDDGNLDQWINAMDVRAVEVYTRASNVPPQFNTMDGCGSVVIHTGQRSRLSRR